VTQPGARERPFLALTRSLLGSLRCAFETDIAG
jgi:hypothetical protein